MATLCSLWRNVLAFMPASSSTSSSPVLRCFIPSRAHGRPLAEIGRPAFESFYDFVTLSCPLLEKTKFPRRPAQTHEGDSSTFVAFRTCPGPPWCPNWQPSCASTGSDSWKFSREQQTDVQAVKRLVNLFDQLSPDVTGKQTLFEFPFSRRRPWRGAREPTVSAGGWCRRSIACSICNFNSFGTADGRCGGAIKFIFVFAGKGTIATSSGFFKF